MTVAVLLPTFNEAESIEEMIKRVRKVDKDYDIYVVDSGSKDGTVEKAKGMDVKVITLSDRGKGIAIKKAFSEIDTDFLVLLDSDTSYAPEEIPLFLKQLENCDVVLGSRFNGEIEKGSMTGMNRFGNKALTFIASTLYGGRITDVCSGFWAFSKKAYKSMDIDAKHFSLEANFYIECSKKKLRVCEIPIRYGVRKGETKLNVMHGFDIGLYLIRKRV